MKRYLSVFGLAARGSFWQGLALMIVSVALAGALLYLTPGSGPVHYVDEYGADQTYEDDLALSELPKASKMAAPLAGGLGGLCSVLAKSGGGKGAKTGYTMRRLQVREGTACLLWVVYDFMMLLLFWALAAVWQLQPGEPEPVPHAAAAGGKKAAFCLCAAGTGQVYGVRRYAVRGAFGRLLYHLAVHNAGELLAVLRRDRPCWN